MDLKDQVGTTHQSRFRVERRHTVPALPFDRPAVTEMPEVLATPMLVAMMEAACIEHIAGLVAAPVLSLGRRVELEHLAATPVGFEVELTTRLVSAEGRQLAFDITASDGIEAIARGRHDRMVVDRDRFVARLADKAGRVPR